MHFGEYLLKRLHYQLFCDNIFLGKTSVFPIHTLKLVNGSKLNKMKEEDKYFIVKKKAVPEVLLKVVEAKHLLDSEKVFTVQEATDAVGISRSSFYKYKDDIFPFHDNSRGKTITFMLQMDDEPGLLSRVLNQVARNGANILTIHQSIPVNKIAMVTISVEILPSSMSVSGLIDKVEELDGIHYLKILARE
jgi:chorismate mutase